MFYVVKGNLCFTQLYLLIWLLTFRVATYKELDSDLLKHVAFATLDDIDLRLLTLRMWPESALKEPDETWNFDDIFAEVSSELQKEWYPEDDLDNQLEMDQNASTNDNTKISSANDPAQGPTKDRPYTAFNRFPVWYLIFMFILIINISVAMQLSRH